MDAIIEKILAYYGMDEVVIGRSEFKDDTVVAILPQLDATSEWDKPSAILLSERLFNDGKFVNRVSEALSAILFDVEKIHCSIAEACLVYAILEYEWGHSDPMNNHYITLQRLNSYTGQRIINHVSHEYCAITNVDDHAMELEKKAEAIFAGLSIA